MTPLSNRRAFRRHPIVALGALVTLGIVTLCVAAMGKSPDYLDALTVLAIAAVGGGGAAELYTALRRPPEEQ